MQALASANSRTLSEEVEAQEELQTFASEDSFPLAEAALDVKDGLHCDETALHDDLALMELTEALAEV